MEKKSFLAVFLILIILPIVSASYNIANNGIKDSYGPGEKITGWINISFANEKSGLNLSTNFNKSIIAMDLLKNKNCNPADCLSTYSLLNMQESKTFSLSEMQRNIVSIILNGNINSINSLSFSANIRNAPSCTNPIKIDVLNDRSYDGELKRTGNDYSCIVDSETGCFYNDFTEDVYIGNVPYCENITLVDSDKFRLGAWIKKDASAGFADDNLRMILFDGGEEVASCNLPPAGISGGEVYCDVNYSNDKIKSFYVCVGAEQEETTKYFTKKEDLNSCGFNAFPGSETEYHDYYIFARGAKFENIGAINYKVDADLLTKIADYVQKRYNNNCTGRCIIPLSFVGFSEAGIDIFNLSFGYRSGGGNVNSKQFYDSEAQEASFSAGYSQIYLDSMNILAPKIPGNYTFIVYLDGVNAFSKRISVNNIPTINSIFPTSVPAGALSKITADVSNAGRNITSYSWNFGDSTSETTSLNYVNHKYTSIGNYTLTLEITDNLGGKTGKTVVISAVNPKTSINATLKKLKAKLSNITIEIAKSEFKEEIEGLLNITKLQQDITLQETKFYSAQNETTYAEIMNYLSQMNVPNSIKETGSTIPYFVDADKIDLDILKEMGAGDYEDSRAYKEAIARWIDANYQFNLQFNYVNAYYDSEIKPIISIFKLKLKSNKAEKVYFVVENDVNINGGEKSDSYSSKIFNSAPEEIIFTSTNLKAGAVNFYLSPSFSKLTLEKETSECNYNDICEEGENYFNCSQDCRPWKKAWVLWAILFAVAIIAYFLMQWWYKVNYEKHLFKDRAGVYNIMNFISNAKSQGINDYEITNGLRREGWNSEQINYVFRKIKGNAIKPFGFLRLFLKKENRYK